MSETEHVTGEVSDEFVPGPDEGPPQEPPVYRTAVVGATPTQEEAARLAER